MRVFIGPYKNYIGPYQIAEMLFFWVNKYDEDTADYTKAYDRVHEFGRWLSEDKNGNDSWLTMFCEYVQSKRQRKVKIHIDEYDTWSLDHTASLIILPMLIQLKETKHGSPYVDLEDVPESMRYTETEEYDSQSTFEFYHKAENKLKHDVHTRWEWVLDEMIWAHQMVLNDNIMEMCTITKSELDFSKYQEDEGKVVVPLRWKQHGEYDWDKIKELEARLSNGLRLFGKYYQACWD